MGGILLALSAYALRAKPTYSDANAPGKAPTMDADVLEKRPVTLKP